MAIVNVVPSLLKGFNTTILSKPDVTAVTAWNVGTITLFTVTGAVLCRVYGVTTSAALTSTAGTGTLAIGIVNSTALFLAATTVNNTTNFIANSVWIDTTPAVLGEALVATNLTWNIVNGTPIILTVVTNSMTAGGMTLYCDWVPVSAGATVV